MDNFGLVAIIITIAVAISYINHRFIKMQPTIAIMFAAILMSVALILLNYLGLGRYENYITTVLSHINFHNLLLNGMLSFLLFAGALTVDVSELFAQKWEISILAIVGTIVSTLLIGTLTYYMLGVLDIHLRFIECLLFGALISPTDPIAVLAMCKEIQAPKSLSVGIAGESLFNDGVGIVLFLSIYSVAFGQHEITFQSVSLLFLRESIGGIIFGIFLGMFANWLIRPIEEVKIEILITLGIVTGGYALAQTLGISGPLAMVVAGMFLGNSGEQFKFPKRMNPHAYDFWELIDEILNAVLFLLIGLEMLALPTDQKHWFVGICIIPIVLLVRLIIVATPFSLFKLKKNYSPHIIKILTWGGLRGGLAVALALAIPPGEQRNIIVTMTYTVVVFSILIQGTTIKPLVKMSKY